MWRYLSFFDYPSEGAGPSEDRLARVSSEKCCSSHCSSSRSFSSFYSVASARLPSCRQTNAGRRRVRRSTTRQFAHSRSASRKTISKTCARAFATPDSRRVHSKRRTTPRGRTAPTPTSSNDSKRTGSKNSIGVNRK